MKRADIQPLQVYGYSSKRAHIYRYDPVMVLDTASYFRSHHTHQVEACQNPGEALSQSRSYRGGVALLAVMMYADRADHDSVRKLRALATVDKAVAALNSEPGKRYITDPDDPERNLGTYTLLHDARHFHGDYAELVREQAESRQRARDIVQRKEEDRLARLATYNRLADRLYKLGITGYHAAGHEDPRRFEKLTFEDMAELLTLAEDGALMRSKA